ncbi:MAG: hypothetical protein AAB964_01510 [Patescibacteria group bacterium]
MAQQEQPPKSANDPPEMDGPLFSIGMFLIGFAATAMAFFVVSAAKPAMPEKIVVIISLGIGAAFAIGMVLVSAASHMAMCREIRALKRG